MSETAETITELIQMGKRKFGYKYRIQGRNVYILTSVNTREVLEWMKETALMFKGHKLDFDMPVSERVTAFAKNVRPDGTRGALFAIYFDGN